jgi:hypothetical protein
VRLSLLYEHPGDNRGFYRDVDAARPGTTTDPEVRPIDLRGSAAKRNKRGKVHFAKRPDFAGPLSKNGASDVPQPCEVGPKLGTTSKTREFGQRRLVTWTARRAPTLFSRDDQRAARRGGSRLLFNNSHQHCGWHASIALWKSTRPSTAANRFDSCWRRPPSSYRDAARCTDVFVRTASTIGHSHETPRHLQTRPLC